MITNMRRFFAKMRPMMVEELATRANVEKDSPEYDKFSYGASVIIMNTPKFIILIVLSQIMGLGVNVLMFMLMYGALRVFSFGVHLKSPLLCTLLGLAYYLGSAIIASSVVLPFPVLCMILVFGFVVFYLYSPAETKKRPISAKQRKRFKTLSVVIMAIHNWMAIDAYMDGAHVICTLLCCAIVCQSINLLPITYKIVRRIEHEKD